MPSYFVIAQILISILLIAVILMQAGSSQGGVFGGGGGGAYRTKRGLEKTLFRLTIVLAILFVVTSVLVLVFS